jgi:kojibiose phosphorylase
MASAQPTSSVLTRHGAQNQSGLAAILFDVDGVLADTARLHEAAWRRLAEREGLPFNDDVAQSLRGLSREASLRRILGKRTVSPDRCQEMMDAKNADYLMLVERLTPHDVLPGARELLHGLTELGIHAAAVSASRNARRVLERLGLADCLGVIVDGEDEARSRTGLHRYLLAAAALRVEPPKCAVVEDSAFGIAAARQFGMRTVGIGGRNTLSAASIVFESLRGVDGRCLLHWLRAPDFAEAT